MADETTTTETQKQERARRKLRQGVVVSAKMNKTIVVREDRLEKHPMYKKYVKRHTKFYVHDETGEAQEGDRVEIMETRPLSKNKRWRLIRVVDRPVR